MKVFALVLLVVVCGCCSGVTAGVKTAPSPSGVAPTRGASDWPTPSSDPAASASPKAQGFTTKLTCSGPSARAMVLWRQWGEQSPVLILDVTDPLKPVQICSLSPAGSARFLSATKVAFSAGDRLGLADLSNGTVVETARLPSAITGGAFSPDGSRFAYHLWDGNGGLTLHLWSDGKDLTLYTQEPLGGHGGPGWAGGPVQQLQFSPDGRELLDYVLFRPISGPPTLQVFKVDGAQAFQLKGGAPGVWLPTGSVLYFSFWLSQPTSYQVDVIDAAGSRRTVATLSSGMNWPSMAPDGQGIIYTSVDSMGLPHLSRLDLTRGSATQLSSAISAETVFVAPTVVWTNEGKPCECGPGGMSMPDGSLIAHDLSTGRDSMVDTSFHQGSTTGGPLYAEQVLDARF